MCVPNTCYKFAGNLHQNTEYAIAVLDLALSVFQQQCIRSKLYNNNSSAVNNSTLQSVHWNDFLPFSLPHNAT